MGRDFQPAVARNAASRSRIRHGLLIYSPCALRFLVVITLRVMSFRSFPAQQCLVRYHHAERDDYQKERPHYWGSPLVWLLGLGERE